LGFVNFMKRESAAKAINELDRVTWGGILLRLAWGQPMPLPAKAIYGIGALSPPFGLHKQRQ
jgi:U2-associated protein SR140